MNRQTPPSMSRPARALARRPIASLLVALLAPGLGFASSARAREAAAGDAADAPSKQQCAEAYESAQEHRASGKLSQTREELSMCAHEACPSFVQGDCKNWLGEVERELPSVVLSPVDAAGGELEAADMTIDGRPVDPGSKVTVDPGPHVVEVSVAAGDSSRFTILAQQGVQERKVPLKLASRLPEEQADARVDSGDDPSLAPYAYGVWGVGAVGLGVFAVAGYLGRVDNRALTKDCRVVTSGTPTLQEQADFVCNDREAADREDRYERLNLIADIGLVTAAAGAVGGALLYFLSPKQRSPSDVGLAVSPSSHGASATVFGRF